MKINQTFYKAKMDEAALLSGYKQPNFNQMRDAIYERICYEFEDQDLNRAVNDMLATEGKINFPLLYKHLCRYRSIRLEREAQEEKMRHHADAERFRALQLEKQACDKQCQLCGFSRHDTYGKRYFCKNIVAALVKKIVTCRERPDGFPDISAWNELRAEFPQYNINEPLPPVTPPNVEHVFFKGYWTDIRYLPPIKASEDLG